MFSLIDGPEETLRVFGRLVACAKHLRTESIQIDHKRCESLDYEAEVVLGTLALEASTQHGVLFGGTLPDAQQQKDIILAAGLPSILGVPLPEPEGFLKFDLFHGKKAYDTASHSSQKEQATTRLTEYIDVCLRRYGFRLSSEGAHYLSSLAGEVISNAEEHSGRRDWWIAGYLHQSSAGKYGDCHITIFNFGKTLCESLHELPREALLRRDIEKLVQDHTRRGLFRRPHWTEENLWTLYALQEGVSRRNVGVTELFDYGQGTADMIEFFQQLGQSKAAQSSPKMCVVSGRTHILFDGTYRLQRQPSREGEERRIIAFNEANDLQQAPDPKYVRNLNGGFPGTLISLRFYFDRDHLRSIKRSRT
ncbi:MAG: hypothetical protein ACREX3_21525 [Gammaproteobacteria bacterium]